MIQLLVCLYHKLEFISLQQLNSNPKKTAIHPGGRATHQLSIFFFFKNCQNLSGDSQVLVTTLHSQQELYLLKTGVTHLLLAI